MTQMVQIKFRKPIQPIRYDKKTGEELFDFDRWLELHAKITMMTSWAEFCSLGGKIDVD